MSLVIVGHVKLRQRIKKRPCKTCGQPHYHRNLDEEDRCGYCADKKRIPAMVLQMRMDEYTTRAPFDEVKSFEASEVEFNAKARRIEQLRALAAKHNILKQA